MSELRSVLDQIAGEDIEDMTVSELDAGIEELVNGSQMIDVLIAKRVVVLTSWHDHVVLGQPSPTAYLMTKRLSAGRAKRHVARANSTDTARATFDAWSDGRISTDQADQLFTMSTTLGRHFEEAETKLIEIVEPLSVRATKQTLEYWRQSVDGPDGPTEEAIRERRGVSLSELLDGMHRIDGWLTPLAAEAFKTSLGALTPPPSSDDDRTPRQRRHDALVDLARHYLDHGDTPTTGGEKPHISIICDIESLQGIAGGAHETVNGRSSTSRPSECSPATRH